MADYAEVDRVVQTILTVQVVAQLVVHAFVDVAHELVWKVEAEHASLNVVSLLVSTSANLIC